MGEKSGTPEEQGDHYFSRGEFEAAAEAYAACSPCTDHVRAKRGWCLAALDQFDEAEGLLTPETCGSSSSELAMLAVVVAGGWGRPKLRGGFGPKGVEARARSEQVSQLVKRALQADEPALLAFFAYKDLNDWHNDREAALAVAERALGLYKSPAMLLWRVLLLRTLGRPEAAALDTMFDEMPEEPWDDYVEEAFETAIALFRYDRAHAALDVFDGKLCREDDPTFAMGLTLLRAYVDFRRAVAGAPDTAALALQSVGRVADQLRSLADEPRHDTQRLVLFAAKLHLALAVHLKDQDAIRRSVSWLIEAYWSDGSATEYSPTHEMMWLSRLTHEADFGAGYLDPLVANSLSTNDRVHWELLNALRTIIFVNDADADAREVIAAFGSSLAPDWAAGTVASVLMTSEEADFYGAGEALAQHCLYAERTAGAYAELDEFDFDKLSAEQLSELMEGIAEGFASGDSEQPGNGKLLLGKLATVLYGKKCYGELKRFADFVAARTENDESALFYGALARHELGDYEQARAMYEAVLDENPDHRSAYWNLALVHAARANPEAIEAMLPALEERAGESEEWSKTRDHVRAALTRAKQQQAATDKQAFVRRELSAFPPLGQHPFSAAELSLVEAACLLALLRASELDHSTWTLTPFDNSSIPFEPTDRFCSALFGLVRKGIIRIADCTPQSAFVVDGGTLRYHLGRVHWLVSPHTLALQRDLRDLARGDWPAHWNSHAETLSRDLAVEECVAYMEHLADERNLDPPNATDARALFRELLEHCSVGKCWYYIYSGVQSANDYRTKFPVSRAQVTAMMLKRTRERGEIAIAKGWDTQYSRIRALPRSHLSAALHDVLTGWGERAFEELIRALDHPA
ncbi:tetratricopeptide repeat protein [Frateuria terrea]|nr:tetratricopeptide repeat protein [Frateuria terrea]